jgi:hypothetical protein
MPTTKKKPLADFIQERIHDTHEPEPVAETPETEAPVESSKDPWDRIEERLDKMLEKEKEKLEKSGQLATGTERVTPEEFENRKKSFDSPIELDPDAPLQPWVNSLVGRTLHAGCQPVVNALNIAPYHKWDAYNQQYPDLVLEELKNNPEPYILAAERLTRSAGRSLSHAQFAKLLGTLTCMSLIANKIADNTLGA